MNIFPVKSFLIYGSCFYKENIIGLDKDSQLYMVKEYNNTHTDIYVTYNNKKIGYVPHNAHEYCSELLKIVYINQHVIRVIPVEFIYNEL